MAAEFILLACLCSFAVGLFVGHAATYASMVKELFYQRAKAGEWFLEAQRWRKIHLRSEYPYAEQED